MTNLNNLPYYINNDSDIINSLNKFIIEDSDICTNFDLTDLNEKFSFEKECKFSILNLNIILDVLTY